MFEGCGRLLDKESVVYMKIPKNIKDKIEKHERMVYFQKNPHMRSCAMPDCEGMININLKKPN